MPRIVTDQQINLMVDIIRDLVAQRRLRNIPIPAQVLKLHHALTTSVDNVCGSETPTAEASLGHEDLICSDEAAAILGCSLRWVTQIHADLDGRKVRRKWRFPRQHVIDYAAARDAGRVA